LQELALSNDLQTITAEINSYKQIAGQSIFEIGKRLKHVKENDLTHGNWMSWCQEEAGFKSEQANKYIKVYERFSNSDPGRNLGVASLYLLTSFTDEEIKKEHLIPSTGEEKLLLDMTKREIEEVKRALKAEREAREKAEQANEKLGMMLTEERNKPAKIVEKEVPSPEQQQRLYETENQLRLAKNEIKRLSEQQQQYDLQQGNFDEEAADRQRKKLHWESEKSVLEMKIHTDQFLEKVAMTAFRKGAIAAADNPTRKKLSESIEALKNFINEIEIALNGRIKI